METLREAPSNVIPPLRAWYGATIVEFLQSAPDSVFAQLVSNGEFALLTTQKDAWLAQIGLLRASLAELSGSVFLEFNIPRMGRRIDAVLLVGPVVFVVEFKVGETAFDRAAIDQVWDYALDLKNFHATSHDVSIVPILLATGSLDSAPISLRADRDKVYQPIQVGSSRFRDAIDLALATVTGDTLNQQQWAHGSYRPTPTIIEAARALYAQHSVEAIARYDAGAQNLRITSYRIEDLVDEARESRRKLICFVTGVPGLARRSLGLTLPRAAEINRRMRSSFPETARSSPYYAKP